MSTPLHTQMRPALNPPPSRTTPDELKRIVARRHFCTLATASADAVPHVVGVTYQYVNGCLYIGTGTATTKARNIRENPRVAVHIPVRQYPFGPPWSVQFRSTASVLNRDDSEIVRLLESGLLKSISRFGVLKEPDVCLLKVKLAGKIHTYGLGLSLREVVRDLAHGDRTIVVDWAPQSAEGGER